MILTYCKLFVSFVIIHPMEHTENFNKSPDLSKGKLKPVLIALDLDDTLLKDDLSISDYTVDIINKAADSGIYIVICSGRPYSAILPTVRRLNIAGKLTGRFVIAQTGTSILDLHTRTEIFSCLTDGEKLKQVFHEARSMGLSCEVYNDNTIFVPYEDFWTDRDKNLTGLNMEVVEDYEPFLEKGFPKIVVPGNPEDIRRLQDTLVEKMGHSCAIVTSKDSLLEIQTKESGKGESLLWLCNYLKIDSQYLMAFGDSFNDETMIQTAPLSVAMINGCDAIKDQATFVTEKTNNEDGVAHFIEKYVL